MCVSDRAEGQRDRRLVEFQLNATRELLATVPVTFVFSQLYMYSQDLVPTVFFFLAAKYRVPLAKK